MAELPKFASINEGALMTELKTQIYLLKTKKTVALAYGFIFFFIAFTIFLAFSPSPNPSSPWFSNIFSISISGRTSPSDISAATVPTPSSISSVDDGSHISSFFSYFFPNPSQQGRISGSISGSVSSPPAGIGRSQNSSTSGGPNLDKVSTIVNNQTHSEVYHDKVEVLKQNQSTNPAPPKPAVPVNNDTVNTTPESSSKALSDVKNQTQSGELHNKGEDLKANQSSIGTVANSPAKANQAANASTAPISSSSSSSGISEKRVEDNGGKNLTSSLVGKKKNGTISSGSAKQGIEDWVKSMVNCNLFDGNWVKDDSYPLYKPGSCSLIDEQFNCFLNGRPDTNYHKLRWKPNGCTIPR